MGTINQKNVVKCQIWKHIKWRTKFKQQITTIDINGFWFCEKKKEKKSKAKRWDECELLDIRQVTSYK